jgi:hypothetical protein
VPLVTDVSFPTLIKVGKPKSDAIGKPKKKHRSSYTYDKGGRQVKLGRKPTPLEERLLSLSEIPARLDDEIERVTQTLVFLREQQLAAVSSATEIRDLSEEMRDIFVAAQLNMARYGAYECRQECIRQGVMNLSSDTAFEERVRAHDRLRQLANGRATHLAHDWVDVLTLTEDRVKRARRPDQWHALAARRLDSGLKNAARDIVVTGFSIGRTMERQRLVSLKEFEPEMLVFTSVLDANTCDECYDADGTEFEEDSAQEAEYAVPYYLCDGGEKCRCQIIAVGSEPGWVNAAIEHMEIIHLRDAEEPEITADDIVSIRVIPRPSEEEAIDLDAAAAKKAWESRQRAEKANPEGADVARAARVAAAIANHKPASAAKQRWAEKSETLVATMLRGRQTTNNAPTDVNLSIGRILHGLEVKTLLDNKNDKITMHPASKARKEAWAADNKAKLHTIVIDDRDRFGTPGWSGHRMYYREGVGSFRLGSMIKVRNAAHLKELVGQ